MHVRTHGRLIPFTLFRKKSFEEVQFDYNGEFAQ